MTEEKKRDCAFCQKDQAKCAILVSGPNETFICDECVHLCSIICGRAFMEKAKRAEDDAAYIEAGQKLLNPETTDIEGDKS
jgi:ATP-dependent Clp protease ATP-binding subunit ClpX